MQTDISFINHAFKRGTLKRTEVEKKTTNCKRRRHFFYLMGLALHE